MKFSEVFINTIQVIIKHHKKLETETELFLELQKLSVVSRSRASTSGLPRLLLDGMTETLFTFFFFFCFSLSFCKDSCLFLILSLIFSLSAGFGGASELLLLEEEDEELLGFLVLELETFAVAAIGVGM